MYLDVLTYGTPETVVLAPSVSAFERHLDKLWSNQSLKYNIEDKPDIIYMRTLQLSHTYLIQETLRLKISEEGL